MEEIILFKNKIVLIFQTLIRQKPPKDVKINISLFFQAAFFFFVFFHSLFGDSFNQKNDFQYWQYQTFSVDLQEKTKLFFETEFRWGKNASELYFSIIQTSIRFSLIDWLVIGPGFRLQSNLQTDRTRMNVYSPLLDILWLFKQKGWQFQDRNRTQYLIFASGFNQWIYRNRLKIITPWKIGKIKLNPFFHCEVFFQERIGFSQSRFCVGGLFSPEKSLNTELFYTLRYIKFPDWRPNHVFGAYFYFVF